MEDERRLLFWGRGRREYEFVTRFIGLRPLFLPRKEYNSYN
jgi:hypothetical protein